MAPQDKNTMIVEHVIEEEYVPPQTTVYQKEWIDMDGDDDSISLESPEYVEEQDLYLQRDGLEFEMPIIFEDGMDFIECNLYYASIESQSTGGALRRLQSRLQKSSGSHDLEQLSDTPLTSILRKSIATKTRVKRELRQRRCSFSGLPEPAHVESALVRSNSMRSLADDKPRRVSFEEYVQVSTIHPVDVYPAHIRSKLWMSRNEMMASMRRAKLEDQERQRKAREEQEQEQAKVARQDSIKSIIVECIHAVECGPQ